MPVIRLLIRLPSGRPRDWIYAFPSSTEDLSTVPIRFRMRNLLRNLSPYRAMARRRLKGAAPA